ncbi:MAG: formylglycine-generating enzyme family protein, partial [Polyangiaceae bacterium]
NSDDTFAFTSPVGAFKNHSWFGAFDMAGNVWEWVGDGYETYPKSDVTDPFVPPTGSRGILRGGSWDYSVSSARTTSRLALSRASAQIGTGFRCAKDAP